MKFTIHYLKKSPETIDTITYIQGSTFLVDENYTLDWVNIERFDIGPFRQSVLEGQGHPN